MLRKKEKLLLMLLGLIQGFLNASLGLGGGIVVIPFLVVILKIKIKEAMQLSLAAIVITSAIGLITHSVINSSNIMLSTALLIASGSIIGSYFGAKLASKINTKLLTRFFTILIAIAILKLTGILGSGSQINDSLPIIVFILSGVVVGFVSSLMGIGGGIIIVPLLLFLTHYDIHQAVATSIAVILPTSLAASYFHRKYHSIDYSKLKFLVSTVVIGSISGAYFNNFMPEEYLKILIAISILFSSIKMLIKNKDT